MRSAFYKDPDGTVFDQLPSPPEFIVEFFCENDPSTLVRGSNLWVDEQEIEVDTFQNWFGDKVESGVVLDTKQNWWDGVAKEESNVVVDDFNSPQWTSDLKVENFLATDNFSDWWKGVAQNEDGAVVDDMTDWWKGVDQNEDGAVVDDMGGWIPDSPDDQYKFIATPSSLGTGDPFDAVLNFDDGGYSPVLDADIKRITLTHDGSKIVVEDDSTVPVRVISTLSVPVGSAIVEFHDGTIYHVPALDSLTVDPTGNQSLSSRGYYVNTPLWASVGSSFGATIAFNGEAEDQWDVFHEAIWRFSYQYVSTGLSQNGVVDTVVDTVKSVGARILFDDPDPDNDLHGWIDSLVWISNKSPETPPAGANIGVPASATKGTSITATLQGFDTSDIVSSVWHFGNSESLGVYAPGINNQPGPLSSDRAFKSTGSQTVKGLFARADGTFFLLTSPSVNVTEP